MSTSGDREVSVRSAAGLGRAIRAARLEHGMTQAELAERALTNRFSITQIEKGETTKAVEKLFDALAALDLELAVRPRRGWRTS
ncbi:helix-turn-helix domain-containing protein [Gordonia pseudamarae]|mgnify:CR=1 FL=1|jgi:HTH-type transcriptional regulator/antitoxin HipB|uniref:Helix-turn-helix domain-containing protein n=1 Tax=Gordonia pseudamarae TaxID=2831662 RepID=A0ABX6IG54_9ACTN|nr:MULTISPECIES: helix-turn-helix transcriptional regulator [Gordonia]MBD0023286.1 helix-turn-helix transcriptional regulator [Gordonia sp. (in: high G+C Gram-positive bacteria)]QHN25893.1 helix-turn-helix domain-containing protein [Gordonia pseudamarae]QHN34823.1 helix-turn-helix domain-containing protein [Gordonia pseudamarae]